MWPHNKIRQNLGFPHALSPLWSLSFFHSFLLASLGGIGELLYLCSEVTLVLFGEPYVVPGIHQH